MHSFSELVLWPWGFGSQLAPNSTALQTLGRRFAWFNDYYPEQSIGLYPTDGTTDDFAYGELGLAAYTFELGTSFFQDCGTFENTILPDNLQALLYAAKTSRTPYITPAGPDTLAVSLTEGVVGARCGRHAERRCRRHTAQHRKRRGCGAGYRRSRVLHRSAALGR